MGVVMVRLNAAQWFIPLEDRPTLFCAHNKIYLSQKWGTLEEHWACNAPSGIPHNRPDSIYLNYIVPAPHQFNHEHQEWEEYCGGECDECKDYEYGELHTLWEEVYVPRLREIGALEGQLSLGVE
jgi:hypothetical protein